MMFFFSSETYTEMTFEMCLQTRIKKQTHNTAENYRKKGMKMKYCALNCTQFSERWVESEV